MIRYVIGKDKKKYRIVVPDYGMDLSISSGGEESGSVTPPTDPYDGILYLSGSSLTYTDAQILGLGGIVIQNGSTWKEVHCHNCPSLNELQLDYNIIDTVDLQNLPNLNILILGVNSLTNFSLTGFDNLATLNLNGSLSLTGVSLNLPNLATLDVGNCSSLNSINTINLPNLISISTDGSAITGLDFSSNIYVNSISIGSYVTSLNLDNNIGYGVAVDFTAVLLNVANLSLNNVSATSIVLIGNSSLATLTLGENTVLLDCAYCTNLTSVSSIGEWYDLAFGGFAECSLSQESIDSIIMSIAQGSTVEGVLDFGGGANAIPSQSVIDNELNTLVTDRGWTVFYNT